MLDSTGTGAGLCVSVFGLSAMMSTAQQGLVLVSVCLSSVCLFLSLIVSTAGLSVCLSSVSLYLSAMVSTVQQPLSAMVSAV